MHSQGSFDESFSGCSRVAGSSRDVRCSGQRPSRAGVLRGGGGLAERAELHGPVAQSGSGTAAAQQVRHGLSKRLMREHLNRHGLINGSFSRRLSGLSPCWRLRTRPHAARPGGSSSTSCRGPSARMTKVREKEP